MNDLGENESSLTFLLNDNNEVVLIGNPLNDDSVRDAYLKELNLLHKDNRSAIKITPENLPMGAFSPMEIKRSKFRIFNNGDTAIKVEDIYTSCDCTSAWTDRDTIHPASSIDVFVECKANDHDTDFIRYVNITLSNKETLSVPLSGFVTRRRD